MQVILLPSLPGGGGSGGGDLGGSQAARYLTHTPGRSSGLSATCANTTIDIVFYLAALYTIYKHILTLKDDKTEPVFVKV